MEDTDGWVVLFCGSTFESAVIDRIRRRVGTADVRRLRRDDEELPSVLIWKWDPNSWDDVRNAGGVTGFVELGTESLSVTVSGFGSPQPGAPRLSQLSDLEEPPPSG